MNCHADLDKHIQPIYLSHAQLFTYDQDDTKQWVAVHPYPVPTSIMFDATRGLYRLISVDNSCKNVIANSTIVADLDFHKTSQRFGHWTDQATGTVYGIGFKTEQQLQDFADCIKKAKAAFSGTRLATKMLRGGDGDRILPAVPHLSYCETSGIILDKNLRDLITRLSMNTEPIEVLYGPKDLNSFRIKPPSIKSPLDFLLGEKLLPSSSSDPTPPPPPLPAPESIPSNMSMDSESGLIYEINKLKQENALIKESLAENVQKYKKWEVQLESLRSQNIDLLQAAEQLALQIEDKKRSNSEIQRECDLLKDHYLNGASQLKGVQMLEEKYKALAAEKTRLEGLIRSYEEGQQLFDNGITPGHHVDCSRQAEELEKYYKGLLDNANRMLSQALTQNMEGKETVQQVDGLFCKAISELSGIHGDLRRAFQQEQDKQRL